MASDPLLLSANYSLLGTLVMFGGKRAAVCVGAPDKMLVGSSTTAPSLSR